MTDYEMVLLRAAVEAMQGDGHVIAIQTGPPGAPKVGALINEGALTALLRDLRAEVPEWPSEERVADVSDDLHDSIMDATEGSEAADVIRRMRALPLSEYLALRGGS